MFEDMEFGKTIANEYPGAYYHVTSRGNERKIAGNHMRNKIIISALLWALFAYSPVSAEEQIELNHTYKELETIWKSRIQSFLDKGIIPLIDLESHLKRKDGERYIS